MSEVLTDVLAAVPTIRYFLIGSEEVAKLEIARASAHVPRAQRSDWKRNQLSRWRRHLDELRRMVKTEPAEEVLAAVARLPYGGIAQADTVEEAERLLDEVGSMIASQQKIGLVGVHEEILSSEIALLWLWPDR